ncbi:MAG: patatin-like phospholipase family protein [Gammaproteobacteria bacterium]|nr:patatin-like phospholipase family protein [Gammaproteobacteria bacterium]
MANHPTKKALILSGGGARAAYHVGVLKAIAEIMPRKAANPFQIICGTSAGAINAASLATHAHDFRKAVQRILSIWANFHVSQVFRDDIPTILYIMSQWFLSIVFAGRFRREKYLYLLDRGPLRKLLKKYIQANDIQNAIDNSHIDALCITASGYSSHQSVSFFQGVDSLSNWSRVQRIGIKTKLTIDHLMASSAIPFLFSPQKINREHFGDGSMRQSAPISPALHLGAERVLIIGNRSDHAEHVKRVKGDDIPSIGQIAGHALDSIFLDSLIADIERVQRINKTVSLIPEDKRFEHGVMLREVDVLVITPSEDMGVIASDYVHDLPRTIRFLLSGIGGTKNKESNLISYLLFERGYCRRLIDLGYKDAMAQKDELSRFLDLSV